MEKVKTGIPGLDEMLGGGLIKNRPYLICGGPGTGKTILAIQFLMQGLKENEGCLFIALEEPSKQLIENMSEFGWDIREIDIVDTAQEIAEGKWFIKPSDFESHPEFTLLSLIDIINKKLDTRDLKRIVIDSLTSIMSLYENEVEMRRGILSLMNFLSTTGCTTVITDEVRTQSRKDVLMEEFLASGVIRIHTMEKKGEMMNGISILKMRGSDFDRHIRPMRITNKGIVVFPEDTLFE